MSTDARSPVVVAIGKFDALHLGHRALATAGLASGPTILLGFSSMASVLGWPERDPLIAPPHRQEIFATWSDGPGISEVQLPFAGIRDLQPDGFLALIQERLGATGVVVGESFRFGRDRCGDVAELVRLARPRGLGVAIVPAVLHDGRPISSSRVREALGQGDCQTFRALTGRDHRLLGRVERGEGRGRALGFPTANCTGIRNQVPGSGVYGASAWIDGKGPYPAAVNVGTLPTIAPGRPLSVEAHLIGFQGDCYGSVLTLAFHLRLRDERRFQDLDQLRRQIAADVHEVAMRLPGG